MKKKVLLFARSFLAEYYSEIQTQCFDPIFVVLTKNEKEFLESKGWRVYGCFEEEYASLSVAHIDGDYLKTSFQSDRFLCRFEYDKRLEILGKEITFWSRIMDETTPDFLVNETVAVEIAEVMAIEAERRHIPFYTYLLGFISGTFYWKPDPFTGSVNNLRDIVPTSENIMDARDYIVNVLEKHERPFYVANVSKPNMSVFFFLKNSVYAIKQYIEETYYSAHSQFRYEDYRPYLFAKSKMFLRRLSGNYDSIEILKGKQYLFYPMHVEPEAILNYFVNENYTQLEVIENIIKGLKVGQYLVVKEHPQHPGVLMSKDYKRLKNKCKNLLYLPSYEQSLPVIKSAEAIITLTSTVGWEALLMGKPVFLLGNIFYDQCSGICKISSFRELKKKLRGASYSIPDRKEVEMYAAKMISQFHQGCPSPSAPNQGLKSFVNAIEQLC